MLEPQSNSVSCVEMFNGLATRCVGIRGFSPLCRMLLLQSSLHFFKGASDDVGWFPRLDILELDVPRPLMLGYIHRREVLA